jgi:hypothetical protein
MKRKFTTPEIEQALGIPRARLKEWIAKGHIVPSVQKASGRGTKHIFSIDDLCLISLYNDLLEHGVKRALAGDVMQRFDLVGRTFSEAIAEGYHYLLISRWVTSGEEPLTWCEFISEIPSPLAPNQEYAFIFNLQSIQEGVDKKIC